MKLLKVEGKNVKGRSFSHELRPVTMLVGGNATGKTAVMEAIRLSLAQVIAPASYPKVSPLFEGFPSMTVMTTTDKGVFSRSWLRKAEGSIQGAGEERPASIIIPPVALDAAEYFGLSMNKQMQSVFRACKLGSEFGEDAITAELKNRLKLDENTEQSEEIVNSILNAVSESSTENQLVHGESTQEWLGQQLEKATERLKGARDTHKRMTGSARASVQLGMGKDDVETKSVTELEAEVARLSKEIEDYAQAVGTLKAEQAESGSDLERVISQRKAINNKLATVPDQSESILALRSSITQSQDIIEKHVSTSSDIAEQIGTRNVTKGQNAVRVATLTNDNNVLQKKIEAIGAATCCPTCKASGEGWKDEVLKERQSTLTQNTIELAELEAAITSLNTEIAALDAQLTTARNADAVAATAQKALNVNTPRLEEANRLQQNRQRLLDELAALGDPANDKPSERDFYAEIREEILKQTNVANERLAVQERLKQAVAAVADQRRQAEEQAALDLAAIDVKLSKITVDVLGEFQTKMVTAAFSTLIDNANLVASCVLKSPLAYKDGDVGRYDEENRWISHRCFSGTEQAATFAAMQFALAKSSHGDVVRVDELGRLSAENKKKFIERMVQLVNDGSISQFIGIDCSSSPYAETEGVHVINIG